MACRKILPRLNIGTKDHDVADGAMRPRSCTNYASLNMIQTRSM